MEGSYLLWKSLHILGIVLLLGNIVVTAWWKTMADRTRDPKVIAFAQRQVTLTDYVFTAPGALLAIATGDYLAYAFLADSWSTSWIVWGRLLFIAAGVIWVTVLIPIQVRQARLARGFAAAGAIPDEYWRLARHWQLFGALAVALPLANLYWMVFKPA
jgi:uncharacterized membrane protein